MLTETRWVELAPVSGWARWSYALLLLGVLVMVGVGLYLTPDPAGHGTHQQLGLPPCTIYYLTGRPCPSCGLTTSVSAILHGQFGLAWRANPMGFLIVAAAVVDCPQQPVCAAMGTQRAHREHALHLAAARATGAVVAARGGALRASSMNPPPPELAPTAKGSARCRQTRPRGQTAHGSAAPAAQAQSTQALAACRPRARRDAPH
jgi:hypothetical protein